MDVYDAIAARRTIRYFTNQAIDRDTIRRIIGAGLRAPTNNHMREWEFVVLDDREVRLQAIAQVEQETEEEATATLDGWGYTDRLQREMYISAIPKQYRMLLQAGSLILPCFKQEAPLLQPAELWDLNRFASIWCCIENMLLAAASEGIYGVTRIPSGEETSHLRKVLGIPGNYEIPCWLALGYPDKSIAPPRQHPIIVEERMHINRWRPAKSR